MTKSWIRRSAWRTAFAGLAMAAVATLFAATLAITVTAALGGQADTAQQVKPPAVGGMNMDQMMKQRMQSDSAAMDEMMKNMKAARESNDPAKMRAAMEQAEKSFTEMKEHMSGCSKMMSMMEGMHHGTAQGSDAPAHDHSAHEGGKDK